MKFNPKQKYGKLKIVRKAKDKELTESQLKQKNRSINFWVCLCDCGKEKIVSQGNLTSENTKSCGCFAKEIRRDLIHTIHTSRVDYTGIKFNKLTAIKKLQAYKNSRTYYKCKCECGKETIVEGYSLKSGHTKSCGCLKNEIDYGKSRRLNNGEALSRRVFHYYKRNAKRRDKEFKLTLAECLNLFSQNCYYCGIEPNTIITHKELFGEFKYNGIDRVHNDLGYTLANCVPCRKQCNIAKNIMSENEFLMFIKRIYNHKQLGEINGTN